MKFLQSFIKNSLLVFIRLYQRVNTYVSLVVLQVFGVSSQCKFEEHCSDYTMRQIKKHGTMRGLLLGIKRILSCWG